MIRSLEDVLVVSDIDNTLVCADGTVPGVNEATIELFCELGGKFTLATGRTVESVRHHLNHIRLSAPAITYGGAVIYDFQHDIRIKNAVLPQESARRALEDICNAFPGIGVELMTADGRIYVHQSNEYTHQHTVQERLIYTMRPLEDIQARWNKVMFAADAPTLKRLRDFCAGKHYAGVYFIPTGKYYFDMMPEGVTKGAALQELCDYLKLPLENTIVVGDYYNDIEMMQRAGHAVAMGNAPVAVQMAAQDVTGGCEEGGLAQVLYGLLRRYGAQEQTDEAQMLPV